LHRRFRSLLPQHCSIFQQQAAVVLKLCAPWQRRQSIRRCGVVHIDGALILIPLDTGTQCLRHEPQRQHRLPFNNPGRHIQRHYAAIYRGVLAVYRNPDDFVT
jgi:hypothetical protein